MGAQIAIWFENLKTVLMDLDEVGGEMFLIKLTTGILGYVNTYSSRVSLGAAKAWVGIPVLKDVTTCNWASLLVGG